MDRVRELLRPSTTTMLMVSVTVALCAVFPGCLSDADQQQNNNQRQSKSTDADRFGSSVVFPITGNVYPKGYYHVTLNIGKPPKQYYLDIDTGSDLTWLQCDAPCTKCSPAPHTLYKPHHNLVRCKDPLCSSVHWPANLQCQTPDEQCDYVVEYADLGLSMGVLVKDYFSLRFTNGSPSYPQLAFGCGYNQEVPETIQPPYTDGVLGLADGKSSILSQLRDMGLSRNVVGHCLSSKGGGFLFFGYDLVPSSGIAWTPILHNSLEKHSSLGPADLHYGGKATGVKGLPLVFDSGSTYSYFTSQAYDAILSTVKKDLNGKKLKDAVEDQSLPVCWKGEKPFKSIHEAKNYFKPVVLSFAKAKNIELQMSPEVYLIISESGNVCFGILNGSEVGLSNVNIIGDISMQDKMVIYDYEKQQIGWVPENCDRLPSMDRDYHGEFAESDAIELGIFDEHHHQPTYGSREDL